MFESKPCAVCENGTLVAQKRYRMGRGGMVIGYILLGLSALCLLLLLLVFVLVPAFSTTDGPAVRMANQAIMLQSAVPVDIVDKVTRGERLTPEDTVLLSEQQKASIRNAVAPDLEAAATARRSTLIAGTALYGFLGVLFGVGGWMLRAKRKVLECDTCRVALTM